MLKKTEIIKSIADKTGMAQTDVEKVLDTNAELLLTELKSGETFTLIGVGKVKPTHRNARTGRNPATGEAIQIAASNGASLSLSKAVKETLNK